MLRQKKMDAMRCAPFWSQHVVGFLVGVEDSDGRAGLGQGCITQVFPRKADVSGFFFAEWRGEAVFGAEHRINATFILPLAFDQHAGNDFSVALKAASPALK